MTRLLSVVLDALEPGGVETFARDLAADLPGTRVVSLAPGPGARDLAPGMIDAPRGRAWYRGPLIGLWWRRLLGRLRPAVVLSHQPPARAFLERFHPRRGPAHVTVAHNDSEHAAYWDGLRRLGGSAAGFVAVSRVIADRLVQDLGVPEERVHVIPCGIAVPDAVGARAAPPAFMLAGRMVAAPKRVRDLAALARTLADRRVDCSLVVAGDGPESHRLRGELEATGLPLTWLGWRDRDAVARCYARATAILQFSSNEGMPIGVREAMACGAVPVLSDIPAHREIVRPGENGLLFPVGDVDACADACATLLDTGRARQLAAAARASVRAHDRRFVAERYERLIPRAGTPSRS